MRLDIRPFLGVGAVRFGMFPSEVRRLFGKEFKSFNRSVDSTYPCDYFPSIGVFAYYKSSAELEAIECALPAQLFFDEINLLGIGFDAAKIFLQSKSTTLEMEVDGAIAHGLGISLYAPKAKENQSAPCESILVFERNYYD